MQETEYLEHYRLIIISIFVLVFTTNIKSQIYPDPKVDSLVRMGIDDLLFQRYDAAKIAFTELDNKYPKLPLGKIYLVALEIAKAYDFSDRYNSDYIEENLDTAETLAKNLLDLDDENIWNRYFIALQQGYYSYFQALEKNWLSALTNGINSVENFEKCLKINPDFYDSYTAVGAFKYWRSRKTEFLRWLPFLKDERESGIKNLQFAIDHETYSNYLAVNSLLWIYIDQKNYKSAIELAEKVLNKYPGSRFFMWPLARAYEEVDNAKSIEIYKKILSSYSYLKNNNHYNEILLKHIIAQQYVKMGNNNEIALQLCNEILNTHGLTDYVINKLEDRFERVKELKKELSTK